MAKKTKIKKPTEEKKTEFLFGLETDAIKFNRVNWKKKLLIGVATEGWVRFEWAHARYGQITPINWEAQGYDCGYGALGYSIDDAYNLIIQKALEVKVDWLLIIEDDVIVPHDLFIKVARYIDTGEIPIVSGLYYSKSEPSQPLVFRGRGNGTFHGWKRGQRVWCDGIPFGCLLIHTSILQWCYDRAVPYDLKWHGSVRRVIETPKKIWWDPERQGYERQEGTQDLFFFDKLIEYEVLKKTGWPKLARKKYPFLCDTDIFCLHVDRQTGRMFPPQ